MKLSFITLQALAFITFASGADVPGEPLASKGKLVFADDFSKDGFGTTWIARIPTAGVENGVMFGRQTGTAHGSVASTKLALPDGNLILECRVQLEHNVTIGFSFDDMSYKGSVAGHIARVTLEQQLIKLHDDKEGAMNNEVVALRKSGDDAKKTEADKRNQLHTTLVPMKLEKSRWYQLGVEIVGDQMRVVLDGKAIGHLKSAGLTHGTKSDLRISVSGKQALFDDLKIWAVGENASTK